MSIENILRAPFKLIAWEDVPILHLPAQCLEKKSANESALGGITVTQEMSLLLSIMIHILDGISGHFF